MSPYFSAQIADRRLTAWGLPSGRSKSKPMWPADRVVFLNDVYFCARDAVRLLQHEGDMVCGLDFDRPKLAEMPGEVCHRKPPFSDPLPSSCVDVIHIHDQWNEAACQYMPGMHEEHVASGNLWLSHRTA